MTTKRDIINVPVEDLRPHPRQALVYGETAVDVAFVESIKRTGILQMPVVKVDEEDYGFVIISGHRRVEAAKQAGLTHVECEVRSYETVEDEEYDFFTANKTRKKSPKQILAEIRGLLQISCRNLSDYYKEVAEADCVDNGKKGKTDSANQQRFSDSEIARITGLPRITVTAYTCIFDKDYRAEVIAEFVRWGVKPEDAAKQVNGLWDSQIPRVESGELSLREVYLALLDAKRDALQRIDATLQRRAAKVVGSGASRGNLPSDLKHPKAAKAIKEAKSKEKFENNTMNSVQYLDLYMSRRDMAEKDFDRAKVAAFAREWHAHLIDVNK